MSVMTLSDETFGQMESGLSIVDFYASWCPPCKTLSPMFLQFSDEIKDIKFGKVDVEQCPELAKKFNISSIPTLVLLKDGHVVEQIVGLPAKSVLQKSLEGLKNL